MGTSENGKDRKGETTQGEIEEKRSQLLRRRRRQCFQGQAEGRQGSRKGSCCGTESGQAFGCRSEEEWQEVMWNSRMTAPRPRAARPRFCFDGFSTRNHQNKRSMQCWCSMVM